MLCNAEVIDVNQDPLGKQARIVRQTDETLVLAKPMEDGSFAVGLFNLSEKKRHISVSWEELGLDAAQRVRDLWRQKDLGSASGTWNAAVEPHGVHLVQLFAK